MISRKKMAIAAGAVCIAGMIACLCVIIPVLLDYLGAEQDYEQLQDQVVEDRNDRDSDEFVNADDVQTQDPDWWYKDVSIDFDELQKKNADIVAWIRFDHLDQIGIDYPVVYTDNNNDYLHKDIYGNEHKAGTLFFEALIQDPVSPSHKKDIMYGHLMKNGSMFAPLKKYVKDSSVYKDNSFFTVYKKGIACRYRIFSYFITTAGSDTYLYGFTSSDEAYRAHIDTLKSRSVVHDYEPDYEHSVLTLSTCAKSNSNQRIVVNAELIDTEPCGAQ